jgi:hypothetical protein
MRLLALHNFLTFIAMGIRNIFAAMFWLSLSFLCMAIVERGSPKLISVEDPTTPGELFPLPKGFQVEPDLDENKSAIATGGKVVKIRQGPFKVEPGQQLSSELQWDAGPQMPCRDCYLTAIQGGLEYADGTPAELNTGAMLQVCHIARD